MILILAILFGVYFIFILEEKFAENPKILPGQSGVFAAAAVFVFLGFRHFFLAADYADMAPLPMEFRFPAVYAVGAFQLLCALGLVIWRTQKIAAAALLLFIVCAIPVHFLAAVNSSGVDGHSSGPVYLVLRLPFELLIFWWVWRFGTFRSAWSDLRDPSRLFE